MPAPRIIRRVTLERSSRPLLARYLAAHGAGFFAARGFSLDALGASPASNRAPVHALFDLLHAAHSSAPPPPEPLRAALTALDSLATPQGADEIIRYDSASRIPRATYGDEDLALVALLDHPELAVDARRAAEAERVQSFTEYEPAVVRALAFGDVHRDVLAANLSARFEARRCTPLCIVHVTRDGHAVSLEIVHARRPRTVDKVDARALDLLQSTDILTERVFVEIDLAGGGVAIHAAVGVKEIVRCALGEVLAGDATYFRAARSYDLAPFRDVDTAISLEGAPRELRAVEIHDLAMRSDAGTVVTFARPRKDLLDDPVMRDPLYTLLALTTPVSVKLYLTIAGRKKPLRVELSVNGAKNRIDFDRDDPAVVEIVRGYLRARGVLHDAEVRASVAKAIAAPTSTMVPPVYAEGLETERPPFSNAG